MKRVPVSELEEELSSYIDAGEEEILIVRDGKPAGVLIRFASEEDWFDYQLENDPRFLRRIEKARQSARAGRAVRLEEIPE